MNNWTCRSLGPNQQRRHWARYQQHVGLGWTDNIQRQYQANVARSFVAGVPLDQFVRQGHLKQVAPDERAFYQQATRGYVEAAQHFARYEQDFITRGQPLPVAPV